MLLYILNLYITTFAEYCKIWFKKVIVYQRSSRFQIYSSENIFPKKKNFLRKDSLISKKETLGNIVLKGKPTEQNEWLDSILSVRNISDEKYLNKWRKVGVNLIKSIPFPSKSDESWKLTSMDKIFEMRFSKNEKKNSSTTLEKYIEGDIGPKIVFVNGLYSKSLSDLSSLDKKFFLAILRSIKVKKQIIFWNF